MERMPNSKMGRRIDRESAAKAELVALRHPKTAFFASHHLHYAAHTNPLGRSAQRRRPHSDSLTNVMSFFSFHGHRDSGPSRAFIHRNDRSPTHDAASETAEQAAADTPRRRGDRRIFFSSIQTKSDGQSRSVRSAHV